MFAQHVNIPATKRATMCSIVKVKNINKHYIHQGMFATRANITATKRATMFSIVKLKNINKHQKDRQAK